MSFYRFVILSVIGVFLLGSCQTQDRKQTDERIIAVSILPQKYLVEQIAGDAFHIEVIVPSGEGPETYEPSAAQVRNLQNAVLYIRNGYLDFENSWLPGALKNNPSAKVITQSEGVKIRSGHDHHDGETHAEHSHAVGNDPHTWLSVKTMEVQAANILQGIIAVDKINEAKYRENFLAFSRKLHSLDSLVHLALDTVTNRTFMMYHPSLSYFAGEYGFRIIAIEYEGKEPSVQSMKQLVDDAARNNIRSIFISSQFNRQSADALAGQLKINTVEFDPLAENWYENMLSIARKLANAHE